MGLEPPDGRHASAEFLDAAGGALVAALEGEIATVYALDSALSLSFVNRAWTSFAQANGGAALIARFGLGIPLRSAIPDVLWPFYERAFSTVLATGAPWHHVYECSSPQQVRFFRMRVLRVGQRSQLIVSNDPVRQDDQGEPVLGHIGGYADGHGIITQCAHCRRVRRPDADIWDWVPQLVTNPAAHVSHGLCAPCLEYHYGEL